MLWMILSPGPLPLWFRIYRSNAIVFHEEGIKLHVPSEHGEIMQKAYTCILLSKIQHIKNSIWAAVNNDVCGHEWCDSPLIFNRDCVTRENYWRITNIIRIIL